MKCFQYSLNCKTTYHLVNLQLLQRQQQFLLQLMPKPLSRKQEVRDINFCSLIRRNFVVSCFSCHLVVFLSNINFAVVRQSSSIFQEQYASCQAVFRQLSGSLQAVNRQSSVSQLVVQQSSCSCQGVVRQTSWFEIAIKSLMK